MAILLWHPWQIHLGLFEGTYIFRPQWQKTTPVKRWTARGPGLRPSERSRRTEAHDSHTASSTIAGTGTSTHSLSGLSLHFFPSPRLLV
ncbi:MAG: hypothetical protein QOF89_1110 [Acidobacteriota bacterium]|jgi:hypothetical protein|nr:hypothetical protein [Acidobacteriota bacterium]